MAKVWAPRPLFDIASEVVELEPPSTFEMKPAICLAGELERVTEFSGPEHLHKSRLKGGTRREGPTLAYRFDDALVADKTVYAGGSYQVYDSGQKRPVIWQPAEDFQEAQLCTTPCAQMFFGHFLHDSLVLEELAARRNIPALAFARKPWLHEPKYRQLFDRHALETSLGHVRRLWLVDERHLNKGWVSRFEALRSRLRSKVTPTGARYVFITRGSLITSPSQRSLKNELELASLLEREGFTILEPEKEDPETIASVLSNAKVVVSVTGSAEVHALLAMPAGATLVEIQLAGYFGTLGKIHAESIGANWAYVVAEGGPRSFELSEKRLLRTLDLVG